MTHEQLTWAVVSEQGGESIVDAVVRRRLSLGGGRPPLARTVDEIEVDVDAFVITTSARDRSGQVLRALERGGAVLCAGPVTGDIDTANAIRDAALFAGVTVAAAYPALWSAQHEWALGVLRSGAIGALEMVHAEASGEIVKEREDASCDSEAGLVIATVRSIIEFQPTRVVGWEESGNDGRTGFSGTFQHTGHPDAVVAWTAAAGGGAGYSLIGSEGRIDVPHAFINSDGVLAAAPLVAVQRADGSRWGRRFPTVPPTGSMLDQFARSLTTLDASFRSADLIVDTATVLHLARTASTPFTDPQRGRRWNLSRSA